MSWPGLNERQLFLFWLTLFGIVFVFYSKVYNLSMYYILGIKYNYNNGLVFLLFYERLYNMDHINTFSTNFKILDLGRTHNTSDKKEYNLTDSFISSSNIRDDISVYSKICGNSETNLPADPQKSVEFINYFNKKLGLSSEDIAGKDALMRESALSFYRASPPLFYNDIFDAYSEKASLLPNPPDITINGDIHIGNFGIVKSASGENVWGMNDFDQSAKGSPEWDLERFTASLVIKAREISLDDSEQKKLVESFVNTYCNTVDSIAAGKEVPKPYLTESSSDGAVKKLIKKSSEKDPKEFLKKYTSVEQGKLVFKYNDELLPVSTSVREKVESALNKIKTNSPQEHPFNIFDICEKKGSGGSSFGLDRYWVLASDGDNPLPIIMELKQLMPSAVIDRSGDLSKADGKSIIEGQKSLGGIQNSLSAYTNIDGFSYLVKEREYVRDTVNLSKINNYEELSKLTVQSAKVIAGSHCAETGNEKLISDWIGGKNSLMSSKLIDFALLYATQTNANFKEF